MFREGEALHAASDVADVVVSAWRERRHPSANRCGYIQTSSSQTTQCSITVCSERSGLGFGVSFTVAGRLRLAGIYRRSVTLASGRYAVLDDGMGFSLVPWRPVIEQRLGQKIAATVRGSGVS
jgi:hypothetical protein